MNVTIPPRAPDYGVGLLPRKVKSENTGACREVFFSGHACTAFPVVLIAATNPHTASYTGMTEVTRWYRAEPIPAFMARTAREIFMFRCTMNFGIIAIIT
jgi:hypothetical protein